MLKNCNTCGVAFNEGENVLKIQSGFHMTGCFVYNDNDIPPIYTHKKCRMGPGADKAITGKSSISA